MTDRMIRLLVIASVIGVFLGGLVTGYLLGVRRAPEPIADVPMRGGPPPLRVEALLDRFTAELGLSPAQRDEIGKLLHDGERAMRETFVRLRPELEARRQAVEAGIAKILTDDQRARYRAMMPDGLPRPPPPGGMPPPP